MHHLIVQMNFLSVIKLNCIQIQNKGMPLLKYVIKHIFSHAMLADFKKVRTFAMCFS